MTETLLQIKDLKKTFSIKGGNKKAKAVDGISLSINKGEIFGLVGESGCGKTVTGKMILRLIEPTEGEINFNGIDILKLNQAKFRKMRRNIQTVFQDPNAALDPKMMIGNIMLEPILLHKIVQPQFALEEVYRLLETVGMDKSVCTLFPHQLSIGQKQRVAIAKAISTRPAFILCDEPVSALDVSVQAQVLNLLMELRNRLGMTYMFISHSLGVVQHVSDQVGIMYLGKIVEKGSNEDIFSNPLHPYAQILLASSPIPDPHKLIKRIELKGEVPLCTNIPQGCSFHPRCPFAKEVCENIVPKLRAVTDSHLVACHIV